MPLDGHDFLVSQGWSGNGTGLRQGAISRPIAIPQKKNLAGLGKDRDEAFPFWDHLFAAASKTIKLKLASDDESDEESSPLSEIKRTATGIMSNRRPATEASVTTSGTSTPDVGDGNTRLPLVAIAKRDAARTSLYARFFRGPILGPDDMFPVPLVEQLLDDIKVGQTNSAKTNNKKRSGDEGIESSTKKRKRDPENVIARAQRKKARKEQKEREKEEHRARWREQRENDETASKVISADAEKKEKKKQKHKSREKEEGKGDAGADRVMKEKGKKKEKSRKSRKDDITAADVPREGAILKSSESIGTLDAEASGTTTHTDQQGNEVRKKKKRRREEA